MKYWASTGRICRVIAVSGALFHLYVAVFGGVSSMFLRSVHLGIVLTLIFLGAIPSEKLGPRTTVVHVFMVLLSCCSTGYMAINFAQIALRAGHVDLVPSLWGIVTIVLVLYAALKKHGKGLPIIAGVFVLYGLLGPYLPYPLTHRGFGFLRIATYLYTTANGIFGSPIDVSSRYIVLFLLFANLLSSGGAYHMFESIGGIIASRTRGGAAKASVVSSALFGMISGSPISNVLVTGSFSIPMMKSTGFSAEWAAAVEATASSGGLIMPPLMGVAAYLMAEILGVGIGKIMASAFIPACLYFLSLYIAIDMRAQLRNISATERSQVTFREVFARYGHGLLPLVVFLGSFGLGVSPFRAAFYGLIAAILFSWVRPWTRLTLGGMLKALEMGMNNAISVAVACAAAGIIVGMISLTGLGFTFGTFITMLSGTPILAFALTAVLCLILGMGMPCMAAYAIMATIAAPPLASLGYPMLAVHFFIFYFTAFASVTPPVALATYTAAGLAQANPWKAGTIGFKLAIVAFLAPFLFIHSPILLLDGNLAGLITALPTAILGIYLFVAGVQGYFVRGPIGLLLRVLATAAGIMFIHPSGFTDLIGIAVFVGMLFTQRMPWGKGRKAAGDTPASG